jgi:hypothetical protein
MVESVVGGFSNWNKCEDSSEEYMILMGAMEKLEELAGKQFGMFQPLDFSSQVVAGRNIQARIKIDEDEVMHVSIFVPLPHTGLPSEVKEWKAGHKIDSDWDVNRQPAEPEG